MSQIADNAEIPTDLSTLSDLIEDKPESLATGSKHIQAAALNAAKFVFDLALKYESRSKPHIVELLSSLTPAEAPETRSQTRANGKRKRSPPAAQTVDVLFEETPLPSLYVEGMDHDQIWEQLDLRANTICKTLEHALEGGEQEQGDDSGEEETEGLRKVFRVGESLEEVEPGDLDELDQMDLDGKGFFDEDESEDEDGVGEDEEDSGDDADFWEGTTELRHSSSDEDEDEDEDEDMSGHAPSSLAGVIRARRARTTRSGAHSELDDRFFDLASFNAETEEAEARQVSRGSLGKLSDDEDSEDDAGSVDMFAPVDIVKNFDEEDLEGDNGEPFYRDFFDPPPSSKSQAKNPPSKPSSPKKTGQVRFHDEVRVKKIKAKGKNLPLYTMYEEGDNDEDEDDDDYGNEMTLDEGSEEEDDNAFGLDIGEDLGDDPSEDDEEDDEESEGGRETIERLKDDLFAEEGAPQTDLSTHEKRMASLREQISTLETENVGKKDWVLMGEANSRARPQNSLLEEDLEFERVMKAVPVVTEETVQGLEERIKVRILDGRFDDVIRIRPLEDKPFLPSRFFELQDAKSSQSLAQIYEDEYSAAQTGGLAGEDRDGKLKKEHEEIEKLWENICGKLDALCNAHFMPKQPKGIISTVSNVSAATLESALPTSKSASTMLAPEEVFAPSSSDPRARSELTPTEKRALRNKERKSKKKARDALDQSVDKYAKKVKGIGGVKKQKQAALESVVKIGRGVTVVGKMRKDVSGKKDRTRR